MNLQPNSQCIYTVEEVQRKCIDTSGLSIFHLNSQSLVPKIDDLIEIINAKFDIILFSETWYKCYDFTDRFPGYLGYCLNRPQAGYGGVALYIKEEITFEIIEEFSVISPNYECISLVHNGVFVCCVYRCHADFGAFCSLLDSMLSFCSIYKYRVAILGDFNVNMLQDSFRSSCLRAIFENYSIKNYIGVSTRPSSGSLLDLSLAYDDESCDAGVISVGLSDHLPIFMILNNVSRKRLGKNRVNIRLFGRSEIRRFVGEIESYNFFTSCCYTNCNSNFDKMCELVKCAFNAHFPIKSIKIDRKSSRKPYITPNIVAHMKMRNKLYHRFLKNRTESNWKDFTHCRNKVNKMIAKSKQQLAKQGTSINGPLDSKVVWRNINTIVGKTRVNRLPADEISNLQLASNFNDYFVNQAVPCVPGQSSNTLLPPTDLQCNFSLEPVSYLEVFECVMRLPDKKSSGVDGFQTCIIKYIAHVLMFPLMFIINQSFSTGVFPDALKIAKITPVYKGKGAHNDYKNYRPISLLPVFSKIFERLIYTRLSKYLEANKLLNESQHGFRKFHSTEIAILDTKEYILKQMEDNKYTVGLFCDLSKAFDTVHHDRLISKLKTFGVSGVPLSLFESYLSSRQQCVDVNGTISSMLPVKRGVPQGSILGPLLFILYINDFTKIDATLKYCLYADDSNIFFHGSSVADLENRVQNFVDKLRIWCTENSLLLNSEKTKIVIFRARNKNLDKHMSVTYNGSQLCVVKDVKFLGVWLDENITFAKHIAELDTKLRKCCGIVNRYRHIFPFKVKKIIYCALFYSNLNYCSLTFLTASKKHIEKLYLTQKRFVRLLCNLDNYSNTELSFNACNITKVTELLNYRLEKIFSKSKHIHTKNALINLASLTQRQNNYSTRQNLAFVVPRPIKEFSRQKLAYIIPHFLNVHNNC